MKKVFEVLAILSLFFLLSTAGALEWDTISLKSGVIRMVMEMLIFKISCDQLSRA